MLKLEDATFFWKSSKFLIDFRNAIKDPEKAFCFKDNGVWTCCAKVRILRREYFYSAVKLLTNSPSIFALTNQEVFQLTSSRIHGKIG